MFEGHFGDPLSNFLAPVNIFETDEATHLNLVGNSLWQVLAYGGYFSAQGCAVSRGRSDYLFYYLRHLHT